MILACSSARANSNSAGPLQEIAPFPAPEITFLDHQHNKHSLKEFRGKTVILNFWATWCFPCIKEIPALEQIHHQFAKKDIVVVPIAQGATNPEQVEQFFDKLQVKHLTNYIDYGSSAFKAFNVQSIPTSIIINPEGDVIAYVLGYIDWISPQVITFLLSATKEINAN